MDLSEIINAEMSRANVDFIVGLVEKKPALFNDILALVLRNEEPVSRRAFWVLDHCSDKHPELMKPHLLALYEALPAFETDAMKRHSLRIIHRYPIEEAYMVDLMDRCFRFLMSTTEPIAVKLFSIHILYAISQKEPGIKNELAACLEFQIEEGSPGVKNIGNRILRKIRKELG